jgi:hypothetical protein
MPSTEITVLIEIVADEDGRWLVRVFKNVYGEYADKRPARVDALRAAKDVQQLGYEDVEVWDRSTGKRLL